jgi:MFS family permease
MTVKGTAHPWFVAGMIALAYAVAYIDRQVLNLLVDPIKSSLDFTDVKFSLLQGLAFVAAYVAVGPVCGRLADRFSRRKLLAGAVLTWSLCTMLCGLAVGFWSFFFARAGIGAAESCLVPAGWSLLADYFSAERLPRAMSVVLIGPFIGSGMALVLGGLVLKHVAGGAAIHGETWEPWRIAFVVVGSPGLLLAAMMYAIHEPKRLTALGAEESGYKIRDIAAFLWNDRRFYFAFVGGMALLVVCVFALPAWTPAVLIRAHGGTVGSVGVQYGTATLLAGCLGVLLGPLVSNGLARRFATNAPLLTAMLGGAGACIATLFIPFAQGYWTVLVASATASGFVNLPLPVAAAALQSATPNRMRGVVTSIYAFVLTSVGLGVAPTAVAFVTDRILGDPTRVGVALGSVSALAAFSAVFLLWLAARGQALGLGGGQRLGR